MATSYITKCLQNARPDFGEDSYTDEDLVALAQAGHASATVILCHRYVPSSHGTLMCASSALWKMT